MVEIKRKLYGELFFTALIGGVIGAACGGIVEAISKTLITGYERWTLPVTAIGYYGFLGILAGISLSIVFILLKLLLPGKIKLGRIFSISASSVMVFILFSYFSQRLGEIFHLILGSFKGTFVFSLMGTILFWVLYPFFAWSYSKLAKATKHPLVSFWVIYFVSFTIAGVVAAVSPKVKNRNVPYNPAMASMVQDKPNIIFILIDALRYDWTSPYGYDISTPTMQSIADDGILFTKAIANSNWTKPSVASIFTSILPKSHGVLAGFSCLPKNLPILPQEMRDAGYYTIGFSTNPMIQNLTGFGRGFNEFYFLEGVEAIPVDPQAPLLRFHFEIRTIIRNLIPPLKKRERTYCDAEKTTDRVLDWLKNNGNRKFFMYLHYMDPHARYYKHPFDGTYANPYVDPSGKNYNFYTSMYKGEIEYCDRHLARLINYLKKSNLYDSSLIFLTADHGEEMFDHYYWGHASSMFEEQIHIPLVIKLPGNVKGGSIDSSLVEQIDYAPTILNLVGITPPLKWDGQYIFSPNFYNSCVISQAENMGCNIEAVSLLGLKLIKSEPCYKKVRSYTRQFSLLDKRAVFPDRDLFDLINDPEEKNNLYDNPKYKSLIDSINGLERATLSKFTQETTASDSVALDQNTIMRLKELGYLQ